MFGSRLESLTLNLGVCCELNMSSRRPVTRRGALPALKEEIKSLVDLPNEVHLNIFSFLSITELIKIERTDKRWPIAAMGGQLEDGQFEENSSSNQSALHGLQSIFQRSRLRHVWTCILQTSIVRGCPDYLPAIKLIKRFPKLISLYLGNLSFPKHSRLVDDFLKLVSEFCPDIEHLDPPHGPRENHMPKSKFGSLSCIHLDVDVSVFITASNFPNFPKIASVKGVKLVDDVFERFKPRLRSHADEYFKEEVFIIGLKTWIILASFSKWT